MRIKKNVEKCNTNPVGKIIRVILSLSVIFFGIYNTNPVGFLGLFTLYTAISGRCGFSLRLNQSKYETKTDISEHIKIWSQKKD